MSHWNETYDALAGCYDDMTEDVNYPGWADFLEKLFSRGKHPVHTVLDLACGTGTMSFLLAARGYELIGVDFSPEMLAIAAEKTLEGEGEPPIFLCQPMEKLDLYGTVDACVCLLDSVNHITQPGKLRRAFERVRLFLEPGGLFVFDVHTPEHLAGVFFWMKRKTLIVYGARITTPGVRFVPMEWTSSAGKGRPGIGRRRCMKSGPIPWRN